MDHIKSLSQTKRGRGLRSPFSRFAALCLAGFLPFINHGLAQTQTVTGVALDVAVPNVFVVPVYGRFSSRNDVTLSARRSGVILLPNATQRSSVSQGETLFEIDCDVERAQREIYSAALRQAELEQVSREQLQKYEATTDLEVAKSRSAVERAAAELQVYESVLDRCQQTAPFGGMIVDQFIQHQEYAREGDPVVHLVDPNDIFFEFLAPASWVDKVVEGGTIFAQIDASDSAAELTVTRVTPIIDAVGQTFKVYARKTGENDPWIRVGMVGRVTLDAAP